MTTPKYFVLLGHPVGHSVSPAIHAAAYRALGLPHRYEVIDCPTEGHVRAQIERLRSGEIAGANVTVPYKRLALASSDRADDSARRTGVANVLALDPSGNVIASNTDAVALAEEIASLTPAPQSAAIIGAGGAARAAVVACQMLGVQRVLVSSRGWLESTPAPLWKDADGFRDLGAIPLSWPDPAGSLRPLGLAAALPEVGVIVQATSAGMRGAGPGEAVSEWIPWAKLEPGAVAIDVVYNPPETPFLLAARQAGVTNKGGLGMLVRQAAAAIRLWLGTGVGYVEPDLAGLHAAAEHALARRV